MSNSISNNEIMKVKASNYCDRKYGLKKGMEFKNYGELCMFLEWKKNTGKSKQIQFRELARFCEYHKQGNKIIIDKVFEAPIEKTDGRLNNRGIQGNKGNTIYNELLDYLIVELIEDYSSCEFSFYQMFCELIPLLSEEYLKMYEMGGPKSYAKFNNMSVGLVMEYLVKLREILKICLHTSLNRLQRSYQVEWEKVLFIKYHAWDTEIAEKEQEEKIRLYEDKVYDIMGIGYYDRINPRTNKEFKEKVLEFLKNDGFPHIKMYWSGYLVHKNESSRIYGIIGVEDARKELQERIIRQVHKAVMNKKCINEQGEIFYPYSAPRHLQDMNRLDYKLWKDLDKNFVDDLNREFALEIYGESIFDHEYSFVLQA